MNIVRSVAAASLVLVIVACGGSSTVATPVSQSAYTFPGGKGGQVIDPSFSAIEGDKFQILGTKPVIVTSLGVENADPAQTDREVAIFDANGDVVVTTTVSTSDTLIDGYYYKTITPVTLTPGNQYYIGALHVAGTVDNYIWNTNTATTPSYIQDLGTYYGGGAIQNGMSFGNSGPRHYAASFLSYQQSAF